MSCSKVFSSPYARGFGLVGPFLGESHPLNQSNSLYGVVFYSILLLFSLFNYRFLATLQMIMSATSIVVSCYLAYILHFVLQDFCVVCVSTYAVNMLLFFTSWCKDALWDLVIERRTGMGMQFQVATKTHRKDSRNSSENF